MLVRVFLLLLAVAVNPAAAQSIPRSILVLDQSDARGPFYQEVFSALRSTINANSKPPITIYAESLDLSRFTGVTYEQELHLHLGAKYRERPIGVVVAIGDAAFDYLLRWRSTLWPSIPVVFGMVDESTVARLSPPNDVTGLVMKLSLADATSAARAVVPGLNRIVLVGDSWESQAIFRHWKGEIPMIAADVEVSEMIGMTMRELRQRVARLPDHTAIVYTAIYSDGEGTYYPPADALALIAETANRPIIIPAESNLGRGAIGGFVMTPALIGQSAAELALRILSGESASSIPIRAGNIVRPIFDWRQMQRWGVSESSLPAGSEIRFRDPTVWDQYRVQILAICAALLVQAALIGWLIFEHRRRHLAEIVARNSMSELTHMNRVATAGELSASIAHEISQPLTGIVTRAAAARRWLTAERPNINKARAALDQIENAGHRAAEIIKNLRSMFGKDTTDRSAIDINKLIWNVLGLVYIDLRKHRIDLQSELSDQLPPVLANQVQLQQVILNLLMNAIDSMRSVEPRVLSVKSKMNGRHAVQVSIEDTGIGIDPANLHQIFNALFTTKQNGMGMGLSICRSIIESHNGRIWVSPGVTRGSNFQFELPTESNKDKVATRAA